MSREATLDLSADFFTGEDKSLEFTVYAPGQSAAAITAGTGTKQDISDWALSWMVKRHRTDADADAIVTKTTADGGIDLTTPASGVCTVILEAEDLVAIIGERGYHHELKRTDDGFRTVLASGQFRLRQAVHDAPEVS